MCYPCFNHKTEHNKITVTMSCRICSSQSLSYIKANILQKSKNISLCTLYYNFINNYANPGLCENYAITAVYLTKHNPKSSSIILIEFWRKPFSTGNHCFLRKLAKVLKLINFGSDCFENMIFWLVHCYVFPTKTKKVKSMLHTMCQGHFDSSPLSTAL